jgi:hypothetical protein
VYFGYFRCSECILKIILVIFYFLSLFRSFQGIGYEYFFFFYHVGSFVGILVIFEIFWLFRSFRRFFLVI